MVHPEEIDLRVTERLVTHPLHVVATPQQMMLHFHIPLEHMTLMVSSFDIDPPYELLLAGNILRRSLPICS